MNVTTGMLLMRNNDEMKSWKRNIPKLKDRGPCAVPLYQYIFTSKLQSKLKKLM